MASRRGNDPVKDIEAITRAVVRNADKIRLAVFQTTKGQMARRIFAEGRATDGSGIGSYAASTRKLRKRVGRQVARVDLSLTQTLERALTIGTSDGMVVMGIVDTAEPTISVKGGRLRVTGLSDFTTTDNAIRQEEHFGKEIFAPSKSEITRGRQVVVKEIDRYVNRVLKR